ncbi:MAG: endonuclease/exonuclease/phosphatase family protein [Patescibacteria group bacterium]|nr:endonuclease/exonuclease/phosphatase family protein [Patescibacteria group bacterium]
MRILLYNIDHGGRTKNNPRGRWPKITRVIKEINPDVAIILEAWSWQQQDLADFAKKTSFKYKFLAKSNTKHNLALLSKTKPKKISSTNKGFHHSVIEANFENKLEIFGVHLSPKKETIRIDEAEKIINQIGHQKRAIILGDFNSLSPQDNYNDKKLLKKFQEKNITKFGSQSIEKKVIKKILKSGLIDITKKFHHGATVYYSVPTDICTDVDHATKLRLDYAFVTPELAKQIKDAKIIKNKLTNHSSDHFPLIVEITD